MANFRTTNKKQRAAQVLCGLLLSTYLTGAYSWPVAWGAPVGDGAKIQGNSVTASGTESSAWGHYAKASGEHATAWGNFAAASGINATAFGWYAEAQGDNSLSFGRNNFAIGAGSTAFGSNTRARADYSTTFGLNTEAQGKTATAFGQGSAASGYGATAWGGYIEGTGDDAIYYDGGTASGTAATAFGFDTTASGKMATAFGGQSEASGFAATAWGNHSVASGDTSTAFGIRSKAQAKNSLAALGGITETAAENSAAIGKGATVTVADAVALGSGSVADTANTISVGSSSLQRKIVNVAKGTADTDAVNLKQVKDLETTVNGRIAALDGRTTAAENAIKYIYDDVVPGIQNDITDLQNGKLDKTTFEAYKTATASTISLMNTAITHNAADISDLQTGKLDKAVYEADKADMAAALDGKANVALDNITEDGKTVIKDLAKGAVNVVGDGPVSVAKSDISGVDTYKVSVKTDGEVKSGDTGIVTGGTVFAETRVSGGNHIKAADSAAKNLEALDTAIGTTADGNYVKASNSVGENLGALDAEIAALAGGTSAGLVKISRRIDNMDSKVEKVGAGAAALAALHPMETDGKFSMAAGYGNYRSANAMAVGLFYHPTDQVMFSMGGSMGNGENLLNVGVSFALDKGISTSKAAMAKKIAAQEEKIMSLTEENAKLSERLAAIEAKLEK